MSVKPTQTAFPIIHVISHGKRFAVKKSHAKRALKTFDFREKAYHYALSHSDKVVVHLKDGSVLFRVGF